MKTLTEQKASNKRKSLALFAGFLLLYLILGWAISNWYGEISLVIAFVVAFGMAITALWFGDDIAVNIARGQQITSREQAPELWDAIETMAISAGVQMPRVYISPDSSPNAFAAGRTHKQALICVNKGLLTALDKEELEGVIAHEMAHIQNLDVRLMTYVAVLAGSIALISELFLRMFLFGGRDRDTNIIVLIVSLIAIILAPIAALLIQMAISRKREFLADATAAELTNYPAGLASALQRISGQSSKHKGNSSAATAHMYISPVKAEAVGITGKLFSTHPPTEERVARLLQMAGEVPHQHRPRQLVNQP